jgi:hypothetical protein
LLIDDGTNVFNTSDPVTAQAATQTITHRFQSDPVSASLALTDNLVSVMPGFNLGQGSRIRTLTANLQVGDNWGAPQMLVEEILEANQ